MEGCFRRKVTEGSQMDRRREVANILSTQTTKGRNKVTPFCVYFAGGTPAYPVAGGTPVVPEGYFCQSFCQFLYSRCFQAPLW